MKLCFPVAALLLAATCLSAQTEESPKTWRGVKIGLNAFASPTLNEDGLIPHPNDALPFGLFSPAFAWLDKRGRYHEIELTTLRLNFQENYVLPLGAQRIEDEFVYVEETELVKGRTQMKYQAAIRLEYGWLRPVCSEKLETYLALGLQPFAVGGSFESLEAGRYSQSFDRAGIHFQVIPHLMIPLDKPLYFEVSIPVVMTTVFTRRDIVNPNAPPAEEQTGENVSSGVRNDFSVRPGVWLRAGLGYRF